MEWLMEVLRPFCAEEQLAPAAKAVFQRLPGEDWEQQLRDREQECTDLLEQAEALRLQLETVQTEREQENQHHAQQIADERERCSQLLRAKSLRAALRQAGATDLDYLLYKLSTEASFDETGELNDPEAFLQTAKERFPRHFSSGTPLPSGIRPADGALCATPDFETMTYSQMMDYLDAHPGERVR